MYAVSYVYDTDFNGIEHYLKFFNTKEDAITFAQEKQTHFADDMGIDEGERIEHDFGDDIEGYGTNVESIWNEISTDTLKEHVEFCTEDCAANRLWIIIKEVVAEY